MIPRSSPTRYRAYGAPPAARFASLGLLSLIGCNRIPDAPADHAGCPSVLDASDGSVLVACSKDQQCPAGTECADGGACQPAFGEPKNDQLIQGFQAAEFDLRVDANDTSAFSWQAPDQANEVVCGLFVNNPEVAGRYLRIVNDSAALYRTHTFRIPANGQQGPPVVSFRTADLSTAHPVLACEANSRLGPGGASYPIVTVLRVGCWAYDSQGIVAATRLLDISVADIPEVQPPLTDCTVPSQQTDGRYCYPAPQTGVCQAEHCVAADADAGSGGAPAGDAGPAPPPLDTCSAGTNHSSCKLTGFQFGRCLGGMCIDQNLESLNLPLVVADCTLANSQTEWLNCFDKRVQGFGTCYENTCRRRCISPIDCSDATLSDPSLPPVKSVCLKQDAARNATCSSSAKTILGVCVAATETAQCN